MGKIFTYQTRLELDTNTANCLASCAATLSKIERKLFARINAGEQAAHCKNKFLTQYGITARQFNALNINLRGKIASLLSLNNNYITDVKAKIKQTTRCIKSLAKKTNKTNRQSNKYHQKQRLLDKLNLRLLQLKQDKKHGKARMCFGSKKLFLQQFNLMAHNYASHAAWLADWRNKRSSQFSLIGSKDETGGNQSCIASVAEDGSLSLKLRVPNCLIAQYGKFITLSKIKFSYGQQEILVALGENAERSRLKHKGQRNLDANAYKSRGQAINYRFIRDSKGWRVFISVEKAAVKKISNKSCGVIGVDLNYNHLAIADIDRHGNLVNSFTIPLVTYGKNQQQTKATVGDVCKELISYAAKQYKPIIIEQLDFQNKKRSLTESSSAKYARMLSSFAYNLIIQMLLSRAFRFGIDVVSVNPAYTSVIGRVKFAQQYNISIHCAAALVIGRRAMRCSERLPKQWGKIPLAKGHHVTLPGLVQIRGEHVWCAWAKVRKQLKTAFAVQYQKFLWGRNSHPSQTRKLLFSTCGTLMPCDTIPF